MSFLGGGGPGGRAAGAGSGLTVVADVPAGCSCLGSVDGGRLRLPVDETAAAGRSLGEDGLSVTMADVGGLILAEIVLGGIRSGGGRDGFFAFGGLLFVEGEGSGRVVRAPNVVVLCCGSSEEHKTLRDLLTLIRQPLVRASLTIALHLSSLRSSVAALPMMKRELFARVNATFIRRSSFKKPMVLRLAPERTQDKMIISFS